MNKLLLGIAVGIVAAVASAWFFQGAMAHVAWLGELFLRSLTMLIVPLVIASMIAGITALGDVRKLGRLGTRTVLFYLLTTTIAVVIGSILVNLIQPGVGVDTSRVGEVDRVAAKGDIGFTDLILSFLSQNVMRSMVEMDLLPIIVFSLAFGAAVTTLGDRARPVADFFASANEAIMLLVRVIMWFAPIGIFGLVAGRFGEAMAEGGRDAFLAEITAVGWYMATVIIGLAIHSAVVLPLLLWALTRRNPLRYASGVSKALLTAFSTASSSATLPLTIEGVTQENQVDPRAADFVLPLGATVNMDGTALYEAVAAIFIAQAMGVDLTFGQQSLIIVTATLAAIGAAGIPEAGLVTMVIVLRAVGLPLEGVGLILTVDWLLDRFRTTVNVWGDAVAAGVMDRHGLSGGGLSEGGTGPAVPEGGA